MRQKSVPEKEPATQVVKNVRRATRRHFSAEDKGIGGLELAVPLGHYHCAKALAPGPWTGRRCGQEAGIGNKLDEHRRGARS